MAMFGQSSFRRVLLTRVLLLSIPILLLGVAVTFRKARTSLLYTARINLAESAARKADVINSAIHSTYANLAIASESAALRSGEPELVEAFFTDLSHHLTDEIQCLQLSVPGLDAPVATTCQIDLGNPLQPLPALLDDTEAINPFQVRSEPVELPGITEAEARSQLNLLIDVPIYARNGQLRYILTAAVVVQQRESADPWSLLGFTAVINQGGIFLAHPEQERVGGNIRSEADQDRFEDIQDNAARGESTVRHINFLGDGVEWLAGFAPIEVPISPDSSEVWAILAVTPLNNALKGLDAITQILIILTTGLLSAHLLAMLYIARDLSRPIEQLGHYAHRIHRRNPLERAPKNFRIRELNHLSEALDRMVNRLEERARELESAWQEAEAANKLKSEFLANTSHELRTPLNAIIGCIRLVQDGCCDTKEEESEFLSQADKAAVHLLKIINDLLDIRRIEEEGLPLFMEVVDLREILREVVELQSVQIQQKGLHLKTPDFAQPIMVKADPARLKQVLLNIVYNATKFTDQGGITIQTHIETANSENGDHPTLESCQEHINPSSHYAITDDGTTPNSWVVISVRDTGIGIDPSQQHKLFRPFVMVDGTTTRKFEGTGLGLAISRNLIEMMGGSITLYSDGLDQGTTVEVILPIWKEAEVDSEEAIVSNYDAPAPAKQTPVSS
jgi:signal transduction histidine kinase